MNRHLSHSDLKNSYCPCFNSHMGLLSILLCSILKVGREVGRCNSSTHTIHRYIQVCRKIMSRLMIQYYCISTHWSHHLSQLMYNTLHRCHISATVLCMFRPIGPEFEMSFLLVTTTMLFIHQIWSSRCCTDIYVKYRPPYSSLQISKFKKQERGKKILNFKHAFDDSILHMYTRLTSCNFFPSTWCVNIRLLWQLTLWSRNHMGLCYAFCLIMHVCTGNAMIGVLEH